MNVIILIDDREAIPIRAIPFVTGGRITPDLVASIFAYTDQWELRLKGVTPYHLYGHDLYSHMLPKAWDGIELDFKLLLKRFKATQKLDQEDLPIRERDSIPVLPPACFVWKDDFEKAFHKAYSGQNYEILNERPGDRELNFSPYIPDDLQEAVMEGFPHREEAIAQQWPWGDYETPLLRVLAAVVSQWCLAGEYPQKKTGKVQESIKAEMKKANIPISDSLVDHIETLISPRFYSHTRQRVNREG
jgi:hypothetical protein